MMMTELSLSLSLSGYSLTTQQTQRTRQCATEALTGGRFSVIPVRYSQGPLYNQLCGLEMTWVLAYRVRSRVRVDGELSINDTAPKLSEKKSKVGLCHHNT